MADWRHTADPPASGGARRRRPERLTGSSAFESGVGVDDAVLDAFASRYSIELPDQWRRFCRDRGGQRSSAGWELLGLERGTVGMGAAAALAGTRFFHPGFPPHLLPVEVMAEGMVACLDLSSRKAPVVLVDATDPDTWVDPRLVATDFFTYRQDWEAQAKAFEVMKRHLIRQHDLVEQQKIPDDYVGRPDDWRPFRFCSQNVVVAMGILRFHRERHRTEAAAVTIADLAWFDEHAPARSVATILFADSYRSGGDLTVHFVVAPANEPKPTRIPRAIARWARTVGVTLPDDPPMIDPEAGRHLFLEAVPMQASLRDLLRQDDSPVDPAAACFGVAKGLWDPITLEVIIRQAPTADRIVHGGSSPLDRLAHATDLAEVRRATLISALHRRCRVPTDRVIRNPAVEHGPESMGGDDEDVGRRVDVVIDDANVRFTATHTMTPGWEVPGSDAVSGTSFDVVTVDGDADQLPDAVRAVLARRKSHDIVHLLIMAPRDILAVADDVMVRIVDDARRRGASVLAAPDYLPALSIGAVEQLGRVSMARQ